MKRTHNKQQQHSTSSTTTTTTYDVQAEERERVYKREQQSLFDKISAKAGADTRNLLLISVAVVCLEIYILAFFVRVQGNSSMLYLALFVATFFLLRDLHREYIAKRFSDYYESFSVKDSSKKPYIRLGENSKADLQNMEDPNDTIISSSKILLKIGYPLTQEYSKLINLDQHDEENNKNNSKKKFFTRIDIATLISRQYSRIYHEEQQTSTINPNSFAVGRINHLQTTGPHGIWGWALSSLKLTGFFVRRNEEDASIYEIVPAIESVGSS